MSKPSVSRATREGLKLALVVWLVLRVVLSAWGAFIMMLTPGTWHTHMASVYPDVVLPGHDLYGYTIGLWNVYDVRHYILIAEQGYESDPDYLTAFFPGLPLLIKLVGFFTFGNSLVAGLLVANICALLFFWYLYRLVDAEYGEAVARRAVVLCAVFPTSFFLFVGYTEAPLLAFTVASLYYGRQHKWWLSGVLAGCAALVKQPGIFLIVPLGYIYWRQYSHYRRQGSILKRFEWMWLLVCPAAAGGYIIYRYFIVGAGLKGMNDLGAGEILLFPGMPLVNALRAVTLNNPLLAADLVEIGFALLMIGLVGGLMLKMHSRTYSLYSGVLAIASLCVSWPDEYRPEADIPRRLLSIFPIFIYLALVIPSPRRYRYLVYISAAVLLVFAGLFVLWVFVS